MVRGEEDKMDSLWEFPVEVTVLPMFSQNKTQGGRLQKGVAKGGYSFFFSEDLLQRDPLSRDEILCGDWDDSSFWSEVANYL